MNSIRQSWLLLFSSSSFLPRRDGHRTLVFFLLILYQMHIFPHLVHFATLSFHFSMIPCPDLDAGFPSPPLFSSAVLGDCEDSGRSFRSLSFQWGLRGKVRLEPNLCSIQAWPFFLVSFQHFLHGPALQAPFSVSERVGKDQSFFCVPSWSVSSEAKNSHMTEFMKD